MPAPAVINLGGGPVNYPVIIRPEPRNRAAELLAEMDKGGKDDTALLMALLSFIQNQQTAGQQYQLATEAAAENRRQFDQTFGMTSRLQDRQLTMDEKINAITSRLAETQAKGAELDQARDAINAVLPGRMASAMAQVERAEATRRAEQAVADKRAQARSQKTLERKLTPLMEALTGVEAGNNKVGQAINPVYGDALWSNIQTSLDSLRKSVERTENGETVVDPDLAEAALAEVMDLEKIVGGLTIMPPNYPKAYQTGPLAPWASTPDDEPTRAHTRKIRDYVKQYRQRLESQIDPARRESAELEATKQANQRFADVEKQGQAANQEFWERVISGDVSGAPQASLQAFESALQTQPAPTSRPAVEVVGAPPASQPFFSPAELNWATQPAEDAEFEETMRRWGAQSPGWRPF